jgi:hypothetical protein
MTNPHIRDVKPGDKLLCDEAFTCTTPGLAYAVRADEKTGEKFINCRDGRHYLDGQKRLDGTLAGMTRANS